MKSLWIFVALLGCQSADPCAAMCQSAADLYGGCLSDWDTNWAAAGYDNRPDFISACETWAWEMRILERDARRHSDVKKGAVDRACQRRDECFLAPDATCEDFTGLDWNTPPWKG